MGCDLTAVVDLLLSPRSYTAAGVETASLRTIDWSNYDGVQWAALEVVTTNTNASTIDLLEDGGVVATITLPASQTVVRQRSATFVPATGTHAYTYRVNYENGGTLSLYIPRLLINQVGATKTQVWVPIAGGLYSSALSDPFVYQTSNTSYEDPVHRGGRFDWIASRWATVDAVEAYIVARSNNAGQGAYVELDNETDATVVGECHVANGLSYSEAAVDVTAAQNFHDGDRYKWRVRSTNASYYAKVAAVFMRITLTSLSKGEVYWTAMFGGSGTAEIVAQHQRLLYTAGDYSSPTRYVEAMGQLDQTYYDACLYDHGTADTGTTGRTDIVDLTLDSTTAIRLVRSSALTLTDGDRYFGGAPQIAGGTRYVDHVWLVVAFATATQAGIAPGTVASEEALGGVSLSGFFDLLPGTMASAEALGGVTLAPGPVTLLPGTIASTEVVNGVTVQSLQPLLPGSISSEEALGGVTLTAALVPGTIPSAEALGGVTLSPGLVTLLPGMIASAESVVGVVLSRVPRLTATPVPLPGSRFAVRVTGSAGTVTDLTDWLDDAEFTLNDQGGYETASLKFHALPEFALPELRPGRLLRAFLDDRQIWRGRTEELAKWPHGLTCSGPWAWLNDYEGFRAVLLDNDLGQWRTDMQRSRSAGKFQVENTDDGVGFFFTNGDYKAGDWVRIVYMPYDGLPPACNLLNSIAKVWLAFRDNGATPSLYDLRICGLTGPYGSRLGVVKLNDENGGVPFNVFRAITEAQLDPDATHTLRALAIELRVTADFTAAAFSGDTPDFNITYASVLGKTTFGALPVSVSNDTVSVTPERAVQKIIQMASISCDYYPEGTTSTTDGNLYNTEDWRFQDSNYTVEQLAWRTIPQTAADAIKDIDALLNWHYGVQDESGLHYRKPWTAGNVPAAHCWYASFYAANGQPQLVPTFRDTCNQVIGVYTDKRGLTRQKSTTADSRTLGSYLLRTHVLALPGDVATAAQAQTAVDRYQADHGEARLNGTWTITGSARRLCDPPGVEHPACFIAPGDFLYLPDAPAGYPSKVRITRVTRRPLSATAEVEVGLNPRRLDAYLARLESRAKRRRR